MPLDRRVLASIGLAFGDLAVLLALRPDLAALARDVAAPHAWVAAAGADGAATTLTAAALWCVALWLGVGLLAAVAARLPGAFGGVARSASRLLLPAAVQRIVAGAAGLGVLLAPLSAGAVGAAAGSVCLPGGSLAGGSLAVTSLPAPAVVPAPTWPVDTPRPTPTLPAPTWPTSPAPRSPAPTGGPAKTAPAAPHPRPASQPGRPARGSSPGRGVVVRSGDSLWRIVAAQLGGRPTPRQIAARWPRWYAVNRSVIGADPGLIRPGQLLHPPASTPGPK